MSSECVTCSLLIPEDMSVFFTLTTKSSDEQNRIVPILIPEFSKIQNLSLTIS